jgi:hypothetical protein
MQDSLQKVFRTRTPPSPPLDYRVIANYNQESGNITSMYSTDGISWAYSSIGYFTKTGEVAKPQPFEIKPIGNPFNLEKLKERGNVDTSNDFFSKIQKIDTFHLNSEVKQFIKMINFKYPSLESFESFINNVHKLLVNYDKKYELKDSIFIDPEYPDWQEIKITIILNMKLASILNEVRPIIYRMADTLPAEVNDKLIIKFRSK